jgi:cytochrome c peroxidase
MKGGLYHDGRFAALRDVIERYNTLQRHLGEQQENDLRNTRNRTDALPIIRLGRQSRRNTEPKESSIILWGGSRFL